MLIPRGYKKLQDFLVRTVQECGVSRTQRINEAKYYREYALNGSANSQYPVVYNKCMPYVEMFSSTLFSPVDARFSIDFDGTSDEASLDMAILAAKILTRDIQKSNTDIKFDHGLFWATVYGSMFLRDVWGADGAEPVLIFPFQMGVANESINDLDRQEAFTITHYISEGQFRRLIFGHPDERDLIKTVMASAAATRKDPTAQNNMLSQLIISGMNNAVTTNGQANTKQGSFLFGNAQPTVGPETLAKLIQLDEVWVRDSDREDSDGDWKTFLTVGENIIDGRYKQRNRSGVEGETGITQICPRPIEGYFWGRSEIKSASIIQDEFNGRANAYSRMAKMRANPARAFFGVSGITQKKYDAQNRPGGLLTDATPNAKMESLAPDMPQEQQYMMAQVDAWFDESGGFTPALKGMGEAGVRSEDHASTLVRTGSSRIRSKAVMIERQYAEMGDFRLKLLMTKNATVYQTQGEKPIQFRLGDLPDDWHVAVDSHSSSPVFSDDNKQLALTLRKLGAIDDVTTIRLTRPPMEDEIIDTILRNQKNQQQMVEKAAAQDPSIWSKILGKGK